MVVCAADQPDLVALEAKRHRGTGAVGDLDPAAEVAVAVQGVPFSPEVQPGVVYDLLGIALAGDNHFLTAVVPYGDYAVAVIQRLCAVAIPVRIALSLQRLSIGRDGCGAKASLSTSKLFSGASKVEYSILPLP